MSRFFITGGKTLKPDGLYSCIYFFNFLSNSSNEIVINVGFPDGEAYGILQANNSSTMWLISSWLSGSPDLMERFFAIAFATISFFAFPTSDFEPCDDL